MFRQFNDGVRMLPAAAGRTVSSKGKSCVNFVTRRMGDAGRSVEELMGVSQEELEYDWHRKYAYIFTKWEIVVI